jgi:hypothetical protein
MGGEQHAGGADAADQQHELEAQFQTAQHGLVSSAVLRRNCGAKHNKALKPGG